MQTKRAGVGLVRIEFVAKSIGIHPMALVAASRPQDCAAEDIRVKCELAFITQQSRHFNSPAGIVVPSQDIGVIAAAFYPHQ